MSGPHRGVPRNEHLFDSLGWARNRRSSMTAVSFVRPPRARRRAQQGRRGSASRSRAGHHRTGRRRRRWGAPRPTRRKGVDSMPSSETVVSELAVLAISVAEGASTGQMLLAPFEERSIARVEEQDMAIAGIIGNDVTSMSTVRRMLESYSRSAIAHIRSAAALMGSDTNSPPVLSIGALSRISYEASSIAYWLADPDLHWGERLKRCNQLQFSMIEEALRPSKKFAEVVPTSFIETRLSEYEDEASSLIGFAIQQGWNHQGKPPSINSWSKGIPSFAGASEISGE